MGRRGTNWWNSRGELEREREQLKEWENKRWTVSWVEFTEPYMLCVSSNRARHLLVGLSYTRLHLCVFGDDVIVRNAHTHSLTQSLKSLERFLANSPILGITLASFFFFHSLVRCFFFLPFYLLLIAGLCIVIVFI